MAFYNLLAAGFLFGTIIMVAVTFFMGYLHWKEERLLPAPVKPAKRPKPDLVSTAATPPAANDTAAVLKAS